MANSPPKEASATGCRWGVVSDAGKSVVSLSDIMAEELAKTSSFEVAVQPTGIDDEPQSCLGDECADDYMIAKMLQTDFDRERDALLKLEERNFNKSDRVCLSFANYRVTKEEEAASSDVDDDYLEYQNNKLDEVEKPQFGRSGVICKQGVYVSKHDKVLCGKMNTSRVLDFPPEFHTGDAAKLDLVLPNNVYNKLKQHSISVTKRQHRLHETKEKSTAEITMDPKTRMALYKMVNNGYLQELSGVIATGKEAAVYFSTMQQKDDASEGSERPVAIKVYKTTLMEFKNRGHYVKQDFRFKNPRKVMRIWTERELLNMKRMFKAGVPVPQPYKARAHLLVMQFIGTSDGQAAPKLKDVDLEADQWADAYSQTSQAMVTMYKACGLVHADMSEFNLLYWDGKVWVIDLAQAVDIHNQDCLLFLARDCENICRFFSDKGVPSLNARNLFNAISDENCISDETFEADVKLLIAKSTPKRVLHQRRRPAQSLLDNSVDQSDTIRDDDFTTSTTDDDDDDSD